MIPQATAGTPPTSFVEESKPRAWVRLLTPSLTDIFFLALLFWLFASNPAGWDRLLWDGDTALHTRIGDFILDHHFVPTTDSFSFTRPGERWFAFQWLTGVVFALLNRTVGLKGIVLLVGVAIVLYLTLLLRDMVKRGSNGLIALLLVMMGANASIIHYHARPHIFTILFLVTANAMIARDREKPSWHIWLLVPLAALWANVHSGFPVLLVVIGLLAVGMALSQRWDLVRRYGILAGACGLATLANPNGIALHLRILTFLSDPWMMDNVSEYQSPVFRSEAMHYYMAFLFVALMVCARHLARRQWTESLWILFFATASLSSARHIPLFIVTVSPLIGVALTQLWDEFTAGKSKASLEGVLADIADKTTGRIQPVSVWVVVIVAGFAMLGSSQNWPTDLSAKYFPKAAVSGFHDRIVASRVFTTDQWGDYLLWTGYPQQKVFIDGRNDLYGSEVGNQYMTAANGQPGWQAVLNRYNVNMVLLPPATPLVGLLSSDARWHVLYSDQQAVLLGTAE